MNPYVLNEISRVVEKLEDTNKFKNKSFFITGATGFIGSYLVYVLEELNHRFNLNIEIYALVRNIEKAKSFGFKNTTFIEGSIENKIDTTKEFDYIIHTASPTDSKYFITNPVEVINNTIRGINNTVALATKKTLGYLFTSSLEVYGICNEDRFIKENEYFPIDPNNVRNSYSEGKKLLECLLSSYASEYQIPVRIVRLGQTFGPGISKNDNRVFAEFARKVTNKEDIILKTKGETKRSYCSILDAILGIFIALFNGENGNSYNLASDDSYYSIYELAEKFIKNTESKIQIIEENDNKYLSTIKFGLDTSKLKAIGYKSYDNLDSMVLKLKDYFKTI